MTIREISFLAHEVSSSSSFERDRNQRSLLSVEVMVDTNNVVAELSIEEILEHADKDLFLDAIGEAYVKHYFDLVNA